MPRVLALVVVAASVCVAAGLAIPTSAVTVQQATISQSQLNDQLDAIKKSTSWQCYMQAQAYLGGEASPSPVEGVSTPAWFTTTATEWANSQATDLAIIGYVRVHAPSALSSASVAAAAKSLATSITSTLIAASQPTSASSQGLACASGTTAGSGAATLASMPGWFQAQQQEAEAAKLGLQQLTPARLPTQGAELEAWYARHSGLFDTTCISLIVTADAAAAETAAAAISAGTTFAAAAKKYSQDPQSSAKGGAVGCIPPTSSSYPAVQQYVGSLPTGGVSHVYAVPNGQGSSNYYLFSVTKRTPHALHEIQPAVEGLNAAVNTRAAEALAQEVQQRADVSVSPALGTWTLTSAGATIVPPPMPPLVSVMNPTANTPVP